MNNYDTLIIRNIFAIDDSLSDKDVITLLNIISGHYSDVVKKTASVKLVYLLTKINRDNRRIYIEVILSRYAVAEDDIEISCYKYILSRLPVHSDFFRCEKVRSVIENIKRCS